MSGASSDNRIEGNAGGRGPEGSAYPGPVDRLIAEMSRLPGIGRRSAERLAFHLLKASKDEALSLAGAIADLKESVRHCSACFNLTDTDPCPICSDPRRDQARVLVVEEPKDLIAIEQTRMYRGLYHVLMGRLSPLDGIEPSDLTIDALFDRLGGSATDGAPIEEVILGLNPTLEGDGTAMYLHDELTRRGVQVTRLARGLLADAIAGRQRM